MGAAIYHWYKHGELKAEGSWISRASAWPGHANLEGAPVDDAYQIPDTEALPYMSTSL